MRGRISEPAVGRYPPRVALALCTSPNQAAIGQQRWGFDTVRGGVDPGEDRFCPRGFGVVEIPCIEGFRIQSWGRILLGWRWLYALQPVSR